MNKKNKRNLKKKLAPVALCGLIVVGASAWLTNKEVATGVNKITVGTTELVFADVEDGKTRDESQITISGSKVIPMTEAYANENLDPYVFSLNNTGSMDLSYEIYLVCDENTFGTLNRGTEQNPITTSVLNIDIDGNTEKGGYMPITALNAGDKQRVYFDTLEKGEKKDFTNWIIYVDPLATTAETQTEVNGVITPATAKYHLEVVAEQTNQKVINISFSGVSGIGSMTYKTYSSTFTGKELGPSISEVPAGQGGGPSIVIDTDGGLKAVKYSEGSNTKYELYLDSGFNERATSSTEFSSTNTNLVLYAKEPAKEA